jgi:hypothetical protein
MAEVLLIVALTPRLMDEALGVMVMFTQAPISRLDEIGVTTML